MQSPNGKQPEAIPQMPHFPSKPGDPAVQMLRQAYGSDGQMYIEYVVASSGRTLSVWITGEDALKWAANLELYGSSTKAGIFVEAT